MDEEECLFEHGNNEEANGGREACANGEKCNDQSCKFSEQKHTQVKIACRFQSNCNRLYCPYKHDIARKAFLEVGSSASRRR